MMKPETNPAAVNLEKLKQYKFIAELKKLPFVQKILLFGSRARNTHQTFSDVDLAIECPAANIKQWSQILDIIDNADTLLLIDCVRLDAADTELKKRILKDGIEL